MSQLNPSGFRISVYIPVKGKSQVGSENRLGPIENGKPNIQCTPGAWCTRDYPLHGIKPNLSDLLKKLSSVIKLLERLNFQLSRDHY